MFGLKRQKYRYDGGHASDNITIVRLCDIDIKECIDPISTIESGEDVFRMVTVLTNRPFQFAQLTVLNFDGSPTLCSMDRG